MYKSSCTSVTRWSASVIKVGVAYVNIRVSKHIKEELAWAIQGHEISFNFRFCFNIFLPMTKLFWPISMHVRNHTPQIDAFTHGKHG